MKLETTFDPTKYSRRALALILRKAQECDCSPAEAEAMLLDELAEKEESEEATAA